MSVEEVGELLVRSDAAMDGYYRLEELTRSVLSPDGWLRTGDLLRRDEEGYFHLAGRAKELIITGGETVYPKEVEDLISEYPNVAEVAVIGVPHPVFEERVVAIVRPTPGCHRTRFRGTWWHCPLFAFLSSPTGVGRYGTEHPDVVRSGVIRTVNGGYVSYGALGDQSFGWFAGAMGRPDFAADPRIVTSEDRVLNGASIFQHGLPRGDRLAEHRGDVAPLGHPQAQLDGEQTVTIELGSLSPSRPSGRTIRREGRDGTAATARWYPGVGEHRRARASPAAPVRLPTKRPVP